MRFDHRLSIFAAVAGGIVLGAAVVLGTQRVRRNERVARKHQHKIDLHEWEGEGGNLAPTQPPVVAAL